MYFYVSTITSPFYRPNKNVRDTGGVGEHRFLRVQQKRDSIYGIVMYT